MNKSKSIRGQFLSVVGMALLVLGLIGGLFYLLKDQINRQDTPDIVPYPVGRSDLQQGEGALVAVKQGSLTFLFSSTVSPMLEDWGAATEETLSKHALWYLGPYAPAPRQVVGNRYFVQIDDRREKRSSPLLQVFDLRQRTLLDPIELYPDFSGINFPDGTVLSDAIADISVDQTNDTVYYIVRKKVLFDGPDRAGNATKDSSADLFRVKLPEGKPEKVTTFSVKISNRPPEEMVPYDLPLVAFKQGSRWLVRWLTKVESLDEKTLQVTTIADASTISGVELFVSQDASRAVVLETVSGSIQAVTTVYDVRGINRLPVATIDDAVYKVIWSPDNSSILVLGIGPAPLRINLNTGGVVALQPYDKTIQVADWVTPLELLVQIPSEGLQNEKPVSEENYRTPYALWNFVTQDFKYLSNQRTPQYLGTF